MFKQNTKGTGNVNVEATPTFNRKINDYKPNKAADNTSYNNIYDKNKSKSAGNSMLEEGEEDFWNDCLNESFDDDLYKDEE